MKLEGKVALVTGGSRNIGRAIALTFADAGADLVICSRNLPDLEKVAREIRAKGRKCLAVRADVSQRKEVNKMVEKTIDDFGRVDILVNNAAYVELIWKNFHETEEAEWDNEIAVSFKGMLYCCKAVIPHMITQRWGRIINITSVATKVISPGRSLYAGCKTAVAGFSRSLAAELGPYGILVNCVAPGAILDPTIDKSVADEIRKKLAGLPVGKPGEPEDIANMVLFLASEEAKYITGQEYSVDGGRTH
ncbi:SDR family NAD(P)-dependent oxidoreductase [Chloroflexota bacterium]